MRLLLLVLIVNLLPQAALAKRNEAYYNAQFCNAVGGKIEHRLPNRTRIDCLTATHAIEADWSHKWYEGVTQALYYALETNREAGLLIIYKPGKVRCDHYARMEMVIQEHNLPIDVWEVNGRCKD